MTVTPALFDFTPARAPLLISVPHAGTFIDPEISAAMTPAAASLADTDWHVDRLLEFATASGAGMIVARRSRYVIDLNRGPSNDQLYPGQRNTGLVPGQTFDGQDLYEGGTPDAAEINTRTAIYWQPYHDRLAAEITRLRDRFGRVVLFDGHSIRARVPTLFEGKLPDLNLGTNDGASADPELSRLAFDILQSTEGFDAVHNGRFKGGYITRQYGRPGEGVHALQLEIAGSCYMDEDRPNPYDATRAAPLRAVLVRLVAALQDWVSSP